MGVRIGGRTLSNLRYADDIKLCSETKNELRLVIQTVEQENETAGLHLTIQKDKSNDDN